MKLLILLALFLTACATSNPCSTANMTAAQIERAIVKGCGR